jgi:hypothetical protein
MRASLNYLWHRGLNAVLARDDRGPLFRLLGGAIVMGIVWLLAALVERPAPDALWLETQSLSDTLAEPFVRAGYAIFHYTVLRHLFLPFLVVGYVLYTGATYLNDLFELKDVGATMSYLMSALFGQDYDTIEIKDGGLTPESKKKRLHEIGGPGYLKVHLGNAALFERPGHISNVYAATPRRFLHGFERLREEVIDLRDQIRPLGNLELFTKDGIPVTAVQAEVVFRVDGPPARSKENPFPFEDKAVRRLIYGQLVTDSQGHARAWADTLAELAREEIARYVGSRSLKDLIAQKQKGNLPPPPSAHLDTAHSQSNTPTPRSQAVINAREPLTLSFYTAQFARRCEKLGVRLLWIGVGTLETHEEVTQEMISAWSTEFEALAKTNALVLPEEKNKIRKLAIQELLRSVMNFWNEHTRGLDQQPLPQDEWPTAYDIVRLYAIKLRELRKSTHQPLEADIDQTLHYLDDLAQPRILGGRDEDDMD